MKPFSIPITPDADGLLRCIRRQGEPKRVHFLDLYLDPEIQEAICSRYGALDGLRPDEPQYELRKQIRLQSFLGYDYVRCGLDGLEMPMNMLAADDTAQMGHARGREFENEHAGPIMNWEQFEKYPWPEPAKASSESLEWLNRNLPENMCIIGSSGYASGIGFGRFFKSLSSLMGYEPLCFALFEQRDLVKAIVQKLVDVYRGVLERLLQFDRVKLVLANDDMGFKTATLIGPADLRQYILPWHKKLAALAHEQGWLYLLHSCGNLDDIMEDLIDDVGIDARHSFEDEGNSVFEFKKKYGKRVTILGGVDVDKLCRLPEPELRRHVRKVLDACMPGGRFCLGSGNSVANYVPMANYLAMVEEGFRYGREKGW